MALREQWAETAMGVVVLALTAGFLTYSLTVGGVHMKRGDYEISAKFGEAGSLAPGAAVTVAGVKVGTVSQITLEPKTYLAVAKLSTDPQWRLNRWVPGPAATTTLKDVVIDDFFFGVSSISPDGWESPTVFPGAAGSFESPPPAAKPSGN